MRILLVEDDENKRVQLLRFLNEELREGDVQTARSLHSALRAIIERNVDLVLLDMTMAMFDQSIEEDGGRTHAYAGREVLRQMKRRDITIPVVMVTQFDRFGDGPDDLTVGQLDAELANDYPDIYRGAVYYNAGLSGWRAELRGAIAKVDHGLMAKRGGPAV